MAVAIGDNSSSTYRRLIERAEDRLDRSALFDGTCSLVRGVMLELIREQLKPETKPQPPGVVNPPPPESPIAAEGIREPRVAIPSPPKRLSRLRIAIPALSVAKTGNLQPYLFKLLQEQDSAASPIMLPNLGSR